MPILQSTTSITEQQFEATLRAALLRVFPLLPASEITHQTTFTFKFGRATITIGGKAKSTAKARSDVLILFRGVPLAVLELKRPGLGLTADDEAQGLSYARMLYPRPPLVVVTDGSTTRLLETHTGKPWQAHEQSEQALERLIANATAVATGDLKQAIGLLMGSDPSIWMQAVRQATGSALDERSGGWDEPLSPFVSGFFMPRQVTSIARRLLEERKRLILVEGVPLAGKSNVLRELAVMTERHSDLAVLYMDADSGLDLFSNLAGLLSEKLNWPVNHDDVRHWLTTLSRANGPALVLAIDNMGADRDDLRRDIEALTSNQFGPGLRIVLAVDDAVASRLAVLRNGRTASTLSKRGVMLSVGPLNDEEFRVALQKLSEIRIGVVPGGESSHELRTPWMLRSMCAKVVTASKYANEELVAILPPVPSLDIIDHVRDRFDVESGPFARYRELAQAVLEDGQDRTRPFELVSELLETFIVRRTTVQAHLAPAELNNMIEDGLIRETKSESGDSIYVIRLPELLASELARVIAEKLLPMSRADPSHAAAWLVGAASYLPLGDIIAAQAIVDAVFRNRGLSLDLIRALLEREPRRETLMVGTRTVMSMPGVGLVQMTFKDKGAILIERGDRQELIPAEPGESSTQSTYIDVHPWLILSHVAAHRFAVVERETDDIIARMDPMVLVTVGACPIVLRRPVGNQDLNCLPIHELPNGLSLVCHQAGIVEPITWSLFCFLSQEPESGAAALIDEALSRGEAALLARLDVALRQLSGSADKPKASWAERVLADSITPALSKGLGLAFIHD